LVRFSCLWWYVAIRVTLVLTPQVTGKVFLVREIKTGQMFALKVLRKDNIVKRNQVEHTKTERSVLGYVNHPFIVGMNMAFQSKHKLYFVLDYCAGGELFFHLGKLGKFPEHRACFYAAEIILAISHVHTLDIIYRDLKPENVLLDAMGHIRLTDFGLSKEGISSSSSGANSFCGTPEYLAPEILNRQGHGRAVDWWSLGALLYEMLTGLPPFYCQDRERLFEKIRKSDLNYPASLSTNAKSILRGLLTKNPDKRLGSGPNDADDIKRHPFFSSINWDRLMRGEVKPPWTPQIAGSQDTSQFDKEFTSMPIFSPQSMQVRKQPLRRKVLSIYFHSPIVCSELMAWAQRRWETILLKALLSKTKSFRARGLYREAAKGMSSFCNKLSHVVELPVLPSPMLTCRSVLQNQS
jgi:serine/threonine protein kinase